MIRIRIFLKKMTFTIKSETDNKTSEIVNLGQQLMQHKEFAARALSCATLSI